MGVAVGTLLGDALDRVIANPTGGQSWHRLLGCYEATPDAAMQQAVQRSLVDAVPEDGIAGFFRATFLAGVTGEAGHIADAGRVVQAIRPIDPERLMAFAAFEWGRALVSEGGLVARLRAAHVPEVIRLAGAHLGHAAGLAARRVDTVRRVALVASFIGQEGHAPTGLALRHAGILQDLGLEVAVFSSQELLIGSMPEYLGNMGRVVAAAPDIDRLGQRLPSGVRLTLGDARFSLMRRWQVMLEAVAAFDPDLVLFVGLYSPLVAPLFRARPVLGLCVHAVAPMAPVDVWLTATPALAGHPASGHSGSGPAGSGQAATWGEAFPPAWGHYHPYRIALKPVMGLFTRAGLGIARDAVVLVTVGARLETEIGGTWAARMVALLGRYPAVVWVLAGGDGAVPASLRSVAEERLLVLRHCDDIRGLLRCCDVYVNPPRVGGGFSVAEAMAEAVAVVAFAGSDGGAKLDRLAVAADDEAGYFARLQALISQPALRAETGRVLQEAFSATLDLARSGPSLLAACAQAAMLFQRRIGGSGA